MASVTARTAKALAEFRIEGEAELCGNHDILAHALEGLAKQLLVPEGTVGLRDIEDDDAALDRRMKQRDHRLGVPPRPMGTGHVDAAEGGGFAATFAKSTLFHILFSCHSDWGATCA
jgi:hypothetical protein